MGLKVDPRFNWFERRILGYRFVTEGPEVVQSRKVIEYNPDYLSIFCHLPLFGRRKRLTSVTHDGRITSHRIDGSESFWNDMHQIQLMQSEKRPWFIVNGDTDLLARLCLTGRERRLVQEKETAFFFYEPLFARSPDSVRCPAFFDENTDVTFPELEWLERFIDNHGGAVRAVAYVCDYGLGAYLRRRGKHQRLTVKTWDLFLSDTCHFLHHVERHRDPNYVRSGYPFRTDVTKKFICLNYRYEGFRELIGAYLLGAGYDGHLSFFHRSHLAHLLADLPFDPRSWPAWPRLERGLELLREKVPISPDAAAVRAIDVGGFAHPDADGVSNQRTFWEVHRHYDEAFLAVVNESRFNTVCGEISEKTLMPILYMRPFVVAGGPGMLGYLRELGFETFHDLWDESYDEIADHGERMAAILRLLDDLLARPLDEMRALLRRLEPRLKRNREHALWKFQPRMHAELARESQAGGRR